MSKWTKNHVVVSGTDKTLLSNLYHLLARLSNSGTFDYGELISALGLNKSRYNHNAFGENLKQDSDGVISWEDSFPSIEPTGVYEAIANQFSGLKVTFCGIDEDGFPFITNDIDGIYFPERFIVIDLGENAMIGKFCTLDELSGFIAENYGVTISNRGDVIQFNSRFQDVRIAEIKERKTQYYKP